MSVVRIPYDIKKIKIPMGEVHIIKDRCKGYGFCIEYCPNDVFVESSFPGTVRMSEVDFGF